MSKDVEFPFKKGDKILDIGCGNGKSSATLIERGFVVSGLDFSDIAVDHCRKLHGDRMNVVCAPADNIPFPNEEFDGIVMIHILEHLTPLELVVAINETKRVLKNGGRIFVRVFSTDDMRSDTGERIDDRTVVRGNGIRYHYFDKVELRTTFSGFKEISLKKLDETTKFGEIRSRIEAVFEKTE